MHSPHVPKFEQTLRHRFYNDIVIIYNKIIYIILYIYITTISLRSHARSFLFASVPYPRRKHSRRKYLTHASQKASLFFLSKTINIQLCRTRFQEKYLHVQTNDRGPTIQMTSNKNNKTLANEEEERNTSPTRKIPPFSSSSFPPPSSRCRCATSRKPSSTLVVVEGRKIVRAVSSCLSLRRVSRARITVDNGPKGSRGRVSEEERGVVKIETLEPRSALESCSPRFFTPAVDDFLALPPRNGPPGLRFFAYYRREGRRLRGLGLPLLTGWMKGWMKEGEKRFGRYPARADRRPRWPLSPLPPRADFGSTGGIGFLATSVVEGSRDDSIVSGCKLNFSVSLVVGPSLPISRVLELTLFFFSFHFSNAWNPFFHR